MLDTVDALNAGAPAPVWDFLGFLADDDRTGPLLEARGASVVGAVAALSDIDADYVIAIGDTAVRRTVDQIATAAGRRAATLVHPTAQVGSQVTLGPGAYLAPAAVLTTNVTVGRHSIVNVGATLSHDVVVGDFATIGPGSHLAGNVSVGDDADLGVGVVARPGATIGAAAVVGAGAVVIADLAAGVVAVGVPAAPLDRLRPPTSSSR